MNAGEFFSLRMFPVLMQYQFVLFPENIVAAIT